MVKMTKETAKDWIIIVPYLLITSPVIVLLVIIERIKRIKICNLKKRI